MKNKKKRKSMNNKYKYRINKAQGLNQQTLIGNYYL